MEITRTPASYPMRRGNDISAPWLQNRPQEAEAKLAMEKEESIWGQSWKRHKGIGRRCTLKYAL